MIKNMEEQEIVIDLGEMFRLLLNKAGIIILWTLLSGLIVYGAVFFLITPQYEASITLYVNNYSSNNRENSNMLSQSDLNASVQLVDTYSAIVTSNTVLEKVITLADVDMEIEDLVEELKTESVNNTEVFQVMVEDSDPKAAARIANAIAEIVPDQISEIVEGSSVKVVDYAKIPEEISFPNYLITALIGMAAGFFICAAVIIIRALQDSSIKNAADFERWEFPVLAAIPDLAEAKRKNKKGYGYGYGYGYQRKKETENGQ